MWVGNASGAAMHDVSGTSGAAPIWAAVMGFLHAREPSRAPRAPPGLMRAPVRFGPAPLAPAGSPPLEAARDEWFVPGTQQTLFAIDSIADGAYPEKARGQKDQNLSGGSTTAAPAAMVFGTGARITAPAPGTVVALDPDIPPARQRLHLRASGQGLYWRMDGKPLGRGPQVAWLPWPGRHVIQITDAAGTVLDEVRIEVRGAGVLPGAAPGR